MKYIQTFIRPEVTMLPVLFLSMLWMSVDVAAAEPMLEVTETVETTAAAGGEFRAESASETTLERRDFESIPKRTTEELLKIIPGLTMVQHGSEGKGYQYFLRGFDAIHGSDLAIDVDGVVINEWSNVHAQGYLDLGFIIPELVESIHVIKGPFAVEQGEFAMAGSASYEMGVEPGLAGLWYTVGSTNRHRLLGLAADEIGDFVAGEVTYDAGFGPRRSLWRGTFNAKSIIYSTPNINLTQLTLAGLAYFDTPTANRDDDVAAKRIEPYQSYDETLGGLSLKNLYILDLSTTGDFVSTKSKLDIGYRELFLRENFTGFLIDPKHGDRREQSEKRISFGIKSEAYFDILKNLQLSASLQGRGSFFFQKEDHVGQNLEHIDSKRDTEALQLLGSGYVNLKYTPTESLTLRGGARTDVVYVKVKDSYGDGTGSNISSGEAPKVVERDGVRTVVSPRVSLSWEAYKGYTLYTAYGRGFRPPEARGFGVVSKFIRGIGDEVNQSGKTDFTTSDAGEIGFTAYPFDVVGFGISGFGTYIQRETIFDHVAGTNLEYNATRRLGVELVIYIDPLPWISIVTDVTYVDARFAESGRPIPFAPQLVAGLRTLFTTPFGLQGGLRLLLVAPRNLPHQARGATLVTFDGTVKYTYSNWDFGLDIENIPNLEVREGEYHYASTWFKENRSHLPTLTTTLASPIQFRFTVGYRF